MTTDLTTLLGAIAGRRMLVVGDAILDVYVAGATQGMCREAPVPVVAVSGISDALGGAANTAANAAALGARPILLSALGEDAAGRRVRTLLERAGVNDEHVIEAERRPTLVKRRILADGHMLLRLEEGSTEALDPANTAHLCERLAALAPSVDVVVISDYGYGTMTPPVIEALVALRSRLSAKFVVDAKQPEIYRHLRPFLVKPSYAEARRLLKLDAVAEASRGAQMEPHGERLRAATGAEMVALTLDEEGTILYAPGQAPFHSFIRPARTVSAVGAGDTFVAALAAALSADADPFAAVELASGAAAAVVAKPHTAVCTIAELREQFCRGDKRLRPEEVPAWAAAARARGRRLVFTNGCFDIFHRGHVAFLSRAKTLGDVLVVGVNDDASVRRLKGPARPVNGLDDRMRVLAALSCVDYVVPFSDDSPVALINGIQPDVYAKGGDYTRETLPEAPLVERLGGTVRILAYVADMSTSQIIDRIRDRRAVRS